MHDKNKERLQREMHSEIWKRIHLKEAHLKRNQAIKLWVIGILFLGIGWLSYSKYDTVQENLDFAQQNTIVYSVESHNALIMLPDSSSVLLEKGSQISYRADFNQQSTRHVTLTGRAYFDIKKNPNFPFIVEAEELKVEVLGTSFDVDARGTHERRVTVKEGSVQVDHQNKTLETLKPQQQFILDLSSQRVHTANLNNYDYLEWQFSDDLVFDNVSVRDACLLFSRKFGYDFEFQDQKLEQTKFTTFFKKEETIEQILKSICTFTNSHFEIDKMRNKIFIKS